MSRLPGVRGTGVDLVHIPGFAEQLAAVGTRFARVFTAGERRRAREAAGGRGGVGDGRGGPGGPGGGAGGDPIARHLAARWAAKEAVIKAWSEALWGLPPVIPPEEVDLAEIEIVGDAWGRPAIRLHGRMAAEVHRTVPGAVWHVSASHDGDYATAHVLLTS